MTYFKMFLLKHEDKLLVNRSMFPCNHAGFIGKIVSVFHSPYCFVLVAVIRNVTEHVRLQDLMERVQSERKMSFIVDQDNSVRENSTFCNKYRLTETIVVDLKSEKTSGKIFVLSKLSQQLLPPKYIGKTQVNRTETTADT